MAATTTDRNTPQKLSLLSKSYDVKAATTIPLGVMVAIDSTGYAINAADAASAKVVGVSVERVDNSAGTNGDKRIKVEEGVFRLGVAGDIVATDVGKLVYVSDNQTVQEATGTNSVKAGILVENDEEGYYWTKITPSVGF